LQLCNSVTTVAADTSLLDVTLHGQVVSTIVKFQNAFTIRITRCKKNSSGTAHPTTQLQISEDLLVKQSDVLKSVYVANTDDVKSRDYSDSNTRILVSVWVVFRLTVTETLNAF